MGICSWPTEAHETDDFESIKEFPCRKWSMGLTKRKLSAMLGLGRKWWNQKWKQPKKHSHNIFCIWVQGCKREMAFFVLVCFKALPDMIAFTIKLCGLLPEYLMAACQPHSHKRERWGLSCYGLMPGCVEWGLKESERGWVWLMDGVEVSVMGWLSTIVNVSPWTRPLCVRNSLMCIKADVFLPAWPISWCWCVLPGLDTVQGIHWCECHCSTRA